MAEHTITSEQLHALGELFRVLIEIDENGSLRVAAGGFVSIITPAGDIVQHVSTGLPNEKARR
jgi:hypothetical protein